MSPPPDNKIIVRRFHSLIFFKNRNLIRNAKSELNYQRIKKFNQVFHSILNCDQNKRKLFLLLSAGLLNFSAAARLSSIAQKEEKSHLNMKLFVGEKVVGVETIVWGGELVDF